MLIKQYCGGIILKAVIYALTKWFLKVPNWGAPEEVRQFILRFLPIAQRIAQSTAIQWDDVLANKLRVVAENRAVFNILYVIVLEAWHGSNSPLPDSEERNERWSTRRADRQAARREARRELVCRLVEQRRGELEAAVTGTPIELDDIEVLAEALVPFVCFVRK
jgi:hypothetical protein